MVMNYENVILSLKTVGNLVLAGINVFTLVLLVGIVGKDVGLVEGVLGRLLELLVEHILHLVLSQSRVLLLQDRHLTLHICSERSLLERIMMDRILYVSSGCNF